MLRIMLVGSCCALLIGCSSAEERTASNPKEPQQSTTVNAVAPVTVKSLRTELGKFGRSKSRIEFETEIEDQVVTCMDESGFQYLPYVSPDPNGFGVVTTSDQPLADLLTGAIASGSLADAEESDPNDAIRSALGQEELVRWNDALAGSAEDLSEAVRSGDRAGMGCKNAAVFDKLGPKAMLAIWAVEDLDAEIRTLGASDQPRLAVVQRVVDCMNQSSPVASVVDGEVDTSAGAFAGAAQLLGLSVAPSSVEEIIGTVDPAVVQGALGKIRDLETELAANQQACERENEVEIAAIEANLEAVAVRNQKADLKALRDSLDPLLGPPS